MPSIQDYVNLQKEGFASIPEAYHEVLKDLNTDEGGKLHRNNTETDITTGMGIYRTVHPTAEVFKYIDLVAASVTTAKSNQWDLATINKVNGLLNNDVMYYLTYLFYKDFYAELPVDLLDPKTAADACNLYANSPEGLKISLQRAIFEVNDMGYINIPKENIYEPIPKIGPKTKENLRLILNAGSEAKKVFNLCVLLYMKTYYINIITSDADKIKEASKIIPTLKYLKGWDTRTNKKID